MSMKEVVAIAACALPLFTAAALPDEPTIRNAVAAAYFEQNLLQAL